MDRLDGGGGSGGKGEKGENEENSATVPDDSEWFDAAPLVVAATRTSTDGGLCVRRCALCFVATPVTCCL